MARTIRFHLDEHVGHAVAAGLRRLGIDVTTTIDAGLLGANDPAHPSFANTHERVIFTEDDDFLVLAKRGLNHPGIVYCKQNTRSIGEIVAGLNLIWEVLEPADLRRKIEFLCKEDRVRHVQ